MLFQLTNYFRVHSWKIFVPAPHSPRGDPDQVVAAVLKDYQRATGIALENSVQKHLNITIATYILFSTFTETRDLQELFAQNCFSPFAQ
jgi:hypothetical protein